MHITTESPVWGIEDRVLCFSKQECKTLLRAADLLAQARDIVGPETDLGTDMGKGEVVLREYADADVVLESRSTINELLGV